MEMNKTMVEVVVQRVKASTCHSCDPSQCGCSPYHCIQTRFHAFVGTITYAIHYIKSVFVCAKAHYNKFVWMVSEIFMKLKAY